MGEAVRALSSPLLDGFPGGLITLSYDGESKDSDRLDFYGRTK